jgi:GxxExxY protein
LIRVIYPIRGPFTKPNKSFMIILLYKKEIYDIVGVCIDVCNTLGYGFLEVVYKDAMEIEFNARGIESTREQEFHINYKEKKLPRTFYADFFLFDCIIVEVKAKAEGISDNALAQTINYLKASRNKLGLVVNFGKTKLDYKRVIF